jgi:hypothetical protein
MPDTIRKHFANGNQISQKMNREDFEDKAREASKAMLKSKAPTQPQTQFVKGALWAWEALMAARDSIYYEAVLRGDVCDRFGIDKPERWQESLITDTAKMMADRDGIEADIRETGRLLTKTDKNMNKYKESNPLYVHLKELQRTIGMYREHLGLSMKAIPARMKESPKQGMDENDPMMVFYKGWGKNPIDTVPPVNE